MSAPALTVGRLTATVRLDGSDDGTGRRVDALLREVAGTRLPRAWSAVDLPPGHWCLRRLSLDLEMEPGRGDPVLSERWARALVAGIGVAVRQGSAEVVHYRRRLDALADAVAQLAVGRSDRAWAWAQVGVLAPGGPDPVAAPGKAALAALLGSPEQIVPTLVTAARRCGMAALDRAVGADGWRQLARRVWETAGGPPAGPEDAAFKGPTSDRRPADGPPPGLLAASELAAAIGRSRLVPAGPVLDAWAVLVAMELDPVLPRRTLAAGQLGRVRAALAAASPGPRPTAGPRRPPAGTNPAGTHPAGTHPADADPAGTDPAGTDPAGTDPAGTDPAGRRVPRWGSVADDGTAGPGLSTTPGASPSSGATPSPGGAGAMAPGQAPSPDPSAPGATGEPVAATAADRLSGWGPDEATHPGQPTDWAGLPFLLATAAAAGLPDRLLDDPTLGTRPLAWCVHAVGRAISGAPGDDPGLLALAGLHGARAAAVAAAPPAGDAERATLDQLARDWVAVTAARLLAASTDPAADGPWTGMGPGEVVLRLVRRAGLVVAEPGWIEVHLALAGVDLAVRRAGLDADPGWVDWLGTVVRFVYA
jgi:hypothetical protein